MIFTGTRSDQAARDRAYTLAESGRFTTVHEVEQALASEGWPNAHIVMESDYARKAIHDRLAGVAH